MFKTINGWTKESMIKHIEVTFKGKSVNRKSLAESDNICMYRFGDKKCGVGMFIPDIKYSKEMESKPFSVGWTKKFNVENDMPLETEGMERLQGVHDNSHSAFCLSDMIRFINTEVTDVTR